MDSLCKELTRTTAPPWPWCHHLSSDPNLWPFSALAFTDPAFTISTHQYCGILWDVYTTIKRKHSSKRCLHVSRQHLHSCGPHCLGYPALHGLVSAGPSPIASESCTLWLPCVYFPEEGTNRPLVKVKLRHHGQNGAVVWSAAWGVLWRRTQQLGAFFGEGPIDCRVIGMPASYLWLFTASTPSLRTILRLARLNIPYKKIILWCECCLWAVCWTTQILKWWFLHLQSCTKLFDQANYSSSYPILS